MQVDNPLSKTELDELDRFLESDATPVDCMDLSMLEGFLTALAIGPALVPLSEWVPQVWGEHDDDLMVFESQKDAERIVGLLLRFYNGIAATFREKPEKFVPLLNQRDKDGKPELSGQDWCIGFMRGAALRSKDWEPLVEDDKHRDLLGPILWFSRGEDKQETHGGRDAQNAPELSLSLLSLAAQKINGFWKPFREKRRAAMVTENSRLAGRPIPARKPRVGRNDPCPCGSGKKFKKCCGTTRNRVLSRRRSFPRPFAPRTHK
jgi:uncharacterized protein